MVIERFYNCAAAEYQCNVHEFISTGEGREFNPGGPVGNQHALKHGHRTKKAIAERKLISELLRGSRKMIEVI